MAEDKKISGLLELSYRTLEELTGNNTPQVLVPVCIENSNYKVDLKTLFGLVYSYVLGLLTDSTFIENIANAVRGSGLTGNGQSSQISNQDLTEITTRLTTLESNYNNISRDLTTPSKWPLHKITITDGTNSQEYTLPTHMEGISSILQIDSTSVSKPLFYATIQFAPSKTDNNLTGPLTITISGKNGDNVLTGGTISKVEYMVEYQLNGAQTLWDSYLLATLDSGYTNNVTPSASAMYSVNISETVSSGTISSVTAKVKIYFIYQGNTEIYLMEVNTGIGGNNRVAALINPPQS